MSSSTQPTIAHSASAPRCTMRNAAPGRFSVRAGCGRSLCADLTAAATSVLSGSSPSAVMPVIFTAEPVDRRVTDTFFPEELEALAALLDMWIEALYGYLARK